MEPRLYDLAAEEWPLLRPDCTRAVAACSLLPAGWRAEKIAVARVAPGGEFFPHRDAYHHVFWFLAGEGEGRLGEDLYPIGPGTVAQVPAGTVHGYRNTGGSDLLLLTVNATAAAAG